MNNEISENLNRSFIADFMNSLMDDMVQVLAFFARLGNTTTELQAAGLNVMGYPIIDDSGASADQMKSGLINPTNGSSTTKIVFENLPKNLSEFTVEAVSSSPGSGPEWIELTPEEAERFFWGAKG